MSSPDERLHTHEIAPAIADVRSENIVEFLLEFKPQMCET